MGVKFFSPGSGSRGEAQCYRNLNFLAHAQLLELDIGSTCGGHGICGGDRIRPIVEGKGALSPLTDDERSHLSAEEIAQGWRLGCQVYPEGDDLEIRVELRR